MDVQFPKFDPSTVELDRDKRIITINGHHISLEVIFAMLVPAMRVLWCFTEEKGEIKAQAFSEDEVIWLNETDKPKKLQK